MNTPKRETAPSVWDVALGALLHDIGKLAQRAAGGVRLPERILARQEDVLPAYQGRQSHWHALWSDGFFDWVEDQGLGWPKGVDPHWVRDLAVYHHNPLQAYQRRPDLATTWLVTIADRAASGFERKSRDEAAEADDRRRDAFRRTPLQAIQTTVRLEGRDACTQQQFNTEELSSESIVPSPSPGGGVVERGYAALWLGFQAGWADVGRRADDPRAFESGVLSLLERFTWSVPSSTVDQPDVSLFDHSRAVAAFAATLHAHHVARQELNDVERLRDPRTPRLRFLVGDLSGLQRTLFRLKSEQVKGLSRVLRGRSLRFQLIAEMAVHRALGRFQLPLSCALQNAGGRFLLLLPELPDHQTDRKVDELRSEFDDWLAKEYSGDLGIGLALSEAFATGDLCPLPDEADREPAIKRAKAVRGKLRMATEAAKLKQLQAPAARAVFNDHAHAYPHGACPACGVRPATGEGARCTACKHEHELGKQFPKARAIVLRPSGDQDGDGPDDYILGGHAILALGEGHGSHDRGLGWRFDSKAHGPAPVRENKPHVPLFDEDNLEVYRGLEDHASIAARDVKTFAALARDSRDEVDGRAVGREMLAVLKADVDRLGTIFGCGLGSEWSIAREAALSRLIDAYFTVRLPRLLRRDFPNTYTVYAGGDDLFLVGPWRQMFELAARLRADFRAFSGDNSSMTISMGLALFDPRTPISIAAREAEARLDAAKDAGRDRISAIETQPMTFAQFEAAMDSANRLNDWLRNGALSTGGLYRFLSFDDARRQLASQKATNADYTWMARFGYHLARMLPNRLGNSTEGKIAGVLCGLFGLNEDFRTTQDMKPGARLAISHALYRNR